VNRRDDDQALLNKVRAALVDYYDHPVVVDAGHYIEQAVQNGRRHEQEQKAIRLVEQALRQDITVRRIAAHAGIPGTLVTPLVQDPCVRAAAYEAEIHHLERQIAQVRYHRGGDVFARVTAGESKTEVAASYGVSRVTLDKWLADFQAAYNDGVQPKEAD
jgi:transposase-like protein